MKTKQKPFILRDWEVRAMLAGRLTKLRRVVNFRFDGEVIEIHKYHKPFKDSDDNEIIWNADHRTKYGGVFVEQNLKSPFGNVGSEFWARETFKATGVYPDNAQVRLEYKAGGRDHVDNISDWVKYYEKSGNGRWISSTQMPREFSRFSFRVTSQRVERVQEITEKSILAEGFVRGKTIGGYKGYGLPEWDVEFFRMSPQDARERQWDADNKIPEFKWTENPWVFTEGIEVLK